jgi:hypothetical protein
MLILRAGRSSSIARWAARSRADACMRIALASPCQDCASVSGAGLDTRDEPMRAPPYSSRRSTGAARTSGACSGRPAGVRVRRRAAQPAGRVSGHGAGRRSQAAPRLNPEFRRNLALELTTHRLLAMPGLIPRLLLACMRWPATMGAACCRLERVRAVRGTDYWEPSWPHRSSMNCATDLGYAVPVGAGLWTLTWGSWVEQCSHGTVRSAGAVMIDEAEQEGLRAPTLALAALMSARRS